MSLAGYGIDPGVQRSALAVGDERGQIVQLNWIPSEVRRNWPRVYVGVLEKPIIYPGIPQTDLNDLMNLRETFGWLKRELDCLKLITPTAPEWKAQVKKAHHHDRIWDSLTANERALLPGGTYERIQKGCQGASYKSEVHNTLDSMGLYLWGVGRIVRGGGPRRL